MARLSTTGAFPLNVFLLQFLPPLHFHQLINNGSREAYTKLDARVLLSTCSHCKILKLLPCDDGACIHHHANPLLSTSLTFYLCGFW